MRKFGRAVLGKTLCLLGISGLLLSLTVQSSQAATIDVIPLGGSNPTLIAVRGPIEAGDDVEFLQKTHGLTRAIVVFRSPGGNLQAALSIGSQISFGNFSTFVAPDHLCASACALAWLGGARRYMDPKSQIGFHAAYVENGRYKRESGVANAVLGSYLTHIGLPLDAIKYITTPGPDEIQWLAPSDARAIGIEVLILDDIRSSVADDTVDRVALESNARRAATAFTKRLKTAGMVGVNESIKLCYERVQELRTERSVEYCFFLDFIASHVDSTVAKSLNVSQLSFNRIETVDRRAIVAMEGLGFDHAKSEEKMQLWIKTALTILLEMR